MSWNVPAHEPDEERRETWPPTGFLPDSVPGHPVTARGQEADAAGPTKIRAIFIRIGRRVLNLAVLLALAVLVASTLTCPLAAESIPIQERATQSSATAVAPHGEPLVNPRFDREQWDLGEAEWQRYHTLMQGIRGSISPATLSPLEVLGIHARDEKERTDYARRWAKLMQEDTARILAFQKAFDEAYAALTPSGPLAGKAEAAPVRAGDRLLLFVRLDDCARCDSRLSEAQAMRTASGATLDIYVVGQASDDAIRAWAQRHRIDPALVRDRRLTLNHDRGELVRLAGVAATAPALIRLRNGTAARLDARTP